MTTHGQETQRIGCECVHAAAITLMIAVMVGDGCDRQRHATKPPETIGLSAMNLSDDPVAAISSEYVPTDSLCSDTNGCSIQVPDSALAAVGRVADVYLEYMSPDYCHACSAYVFDYPHAVWRQFVSRAARPSCAENPMPGQRLLGLLSPNPAQDFFDTTGALRVKGNIWSPALSVLRYRDDYQCIKFSSLGGFYPTALAWDGKRLWVVLQRITLAVGDSVLLIDPDGAVVRSFWLPDLAIYDMAWSGTEIWIMHDADAAVLSTLDSTGVVVRGFPLGGKQSERGGGMVWADGHLWVRQNRVNPLRVALLAINPDASRDSGRAIIDRQFSHEFGYVWSIAADESRIYVTESASPALEAWSLDGKLVGSWSYHVFFPVAMTWDGATFWILHRGSERAPGSDYVLSRFYPR